MKKQKYQELKQSIRLTNSQRSDTEKIEEGEKIAIEMK